MKVEHLVPMREINPAISFHVAQAIERAANTQPEERFQSVSEFQQALLPPTADAAETVVSGAATKPSEQDGTRSKTTAYKLVDSNAHGDWCCPCRNGAWLA